MFSKSSFFNRIVSNIQYSPPLQSPIQLCLGPNSSLSQASLLYATVSHIPTSTTHNSLTHVTVPHLPQALTSYNIQDSTISHVIQYPTWTYKLQYTRLHNFPRATVSNMELSPQCQFTSFQLASVSKMAIYHKQVSHLSVSTTCPFYHLPLSTTCQSLPQASVSLMHHMPVSHMPQTTTCHNLPHVSLQYATVSPQSPTCHTCPQATVYHIPFLHMPQYLTCQNPHTQ